MFLTRQKILVAYLYLLWKSCSKLHLMKSLFLYCQEFENNIYDFHPYLRWPFSELVYLDLRKLDEKWIIKSKEYTLEIIDRDKIKQVISKLDPQIIYMISSIITKYWNMSDKVIMDTVYNRYPYFAINNPNKKKDYKNFDPRIQDINKIATIFTIWYEWITIDTYIDRLIKNNVHILVDVRKNPNSMKYWFSSRRLKDICENRDIKYINIRELWIEWEERKELNSYEDYKKLFIEYRKTLPSKNQYINEIKNLLDLWNRIALTCFEADCNYCHRNEVANYLHDYINWKYDLKHI